MAVKKVKKTVVKKKTAKKTIKKVTKKTSVKKTAKKTVAKKTPVKKLAKKAVAKKTPVKKLAKKAVTKKTPVKKLAKKVVAKKTPVKKLAKKAVAKKTPIKKIAKKVVAKKTLVKKINSRVKVTIKSESPKVKLMQKQTSKPIKKIGDIVAPPAVKKADIINFVAGDFVVYPAHGVGQVDGVDTQSIGGIEVTFYTIVFEKDRMRLKLPISKAKISGLRKLSSKDRLKDALSTLQGRSQVRRIMWSRRAQEYETKINSGDPVSIAEVLRDLKKEEDQGDQSYSERQIYQAALARLAREVAAIEDIDEDKAIEKLESVLSKVA